MYFDGRPSLITHHYIPANMMVKREYQEVEVEDHDDHSGASMFIKSESSENGDAQSLISSANTTPLKRAQPSPSSKRTKKGEEGDGQTPKSKSKSKSPSTAKSVDPLQSFSLQDETTAG